MHPKTEIVALDAVIKDAEKFIKYFRIPVAESAPHIYISALPFAPSTSAIFNLYAGQFPRSLSLNRGRLNGWPPLPMTMSAPNRPWIHCVAISMDGEFIAGGLPFGKICMWDASTGMVVAGPLNLADNSFQHGQQYDAATASATEMGDDNRCEDKQKAFVSSVAFSHDGRYLAAGLGDGGIHTWEVACKQEAKIGAERVLKQWHTKFISALSFSHNNDLLLSGSGDCTVLVWNLQTGDIVAGPFGGHNNPIWSVSFLPDNEHVLSRSGSRTVQAWNMKTKKQAIGPFRFEKVEIPTGTVVTLAFRQGSSGFSWSLPRAKGKFSGCSWKEAVESGETSQEFVYQVLVTVFSPDGKLVATCNDHLIFVWHTTGPLAGTLAGGPFANNYTLCLAFSPNGRRLVSGSINGLVRLWVVEHSMESEADQGLNPISVAFFPNNRKIVVGSRGGLIRVRDILAGCEVKIEGGYEDGALVVAVSRCSAFIALASKGQLHIRTVGTGEATEPTRIESTDGPILFAAFSPVANDVVASVTFNGTLYLWSASNGKPLAGPKQISGRPRSFAVSSTTGIRVATGLNDGRVFIWDTTSGHLAGPFKHHDHAVKALVFLRQDRCIASAATDSSVCLWDSNSGGAVCGPVRFTEEEGIGSLIKASPYGVALTEDGKKVAFELKDHRILVSELTYDINAHTISVQVLFLLGGHSEYAKCLEFSEDGQFLAGLSANRTLRVWNLHTREQAAFNKASDNTHEEIACITDKAFIDEDGWITRTELEDSDGSAVRLLWIPDLHRPSLPWRRSVLMLGWEETSLDTEKFVHGKDWVKLSESSILPQ